MTSELLTTGSRRFFTSAGLYGNRKIENIFVLVLLFAAILGGFATYAALTRTTPFGNDPDTVIWLLNINIALLLTLAILVARRVGSLWSRRKQGLAGSHLHVRLIYTFSILAAAPAIIMTVFSAFFFHFGVQTWFSERVSTAVNESQAVAEAYLEEHRQVIRADALAMANDLDRQAEFLLANEEAFGSIMRTQTLLRNFSEAIVFDLTGNVISRAGLTLALEYENIAPNILKKAEEGEVVVTTGGNDDRVRALTRLNNIPDTFLYVGRMVDQKVLSHVKATREASENYATLQQRYSGLQVASTAIYLVVGFLLVLAAIWFGLILAGQLVRPITLLISTSDRVRAGDLTARLSEDTGLQEFDYLAQSFNKMTRQIEEQQNALIHANRQLDRRRRFTETVLAGVSSGVLGIDPKGHVNLANNATLKLLALEEKDVVGQSIENILPELTSLLGQAHNKPQTVTQGEVIISKKDGSRKIFLVRIAIELIGDLDMGAIVTFDDMTEFQAAQRKAAWSDVARRIAHEIKNPLTPIQLSAERLKRKYLSQIKDDPETFSQCTDTIIRHVGDIGHMVDEFSAFARMPEPKMVQKDLDVHVNETLFLLREAHPDILFTMNVDAANCSCTFDPQQIRQALTNLLQNAVDSIALRRRDDAGSAGGHIDIVLSDRGPEGMAIAITDDGTGFPAGENPANLMEPYVTHKTHGTGLGLAIVRKIMEDHQGKVEIGTPEWLKSSPFWNDYGVATVVVFLARTKPA